MWQRMYNVNQALRHDKRTRQNTENSGITMFVLHKYTRKKKSMNKRGIFITWGEQMNKTIQKELAKNSLFMFQQK